MDKISNIVAADHYHHSLAAGKSTHLVQFYEEEEYLYHVLSDFLAPLLVDDKASVGAIVLARPQTIKYLGDCLVTREYAWDGAVDNEERRRKDGVNGFVTSFGAVYRKGRRTVLLVDADEVLTHIVPKNELNAEEFDNTIIELISQIHPGGSTGLLETGEEDPQPIYAYGELVDMLCARGQHLLALELETLWNRLLSSYTISLLCGYKMDSFRGSSVENIFAQICHSHAAVTPTESYSNLTTANQKFAMIARLQQQVTALRATRQSHWSDGDAEQRTRYREQFVDVLCHELRNPVSGIIGNVELLRMGLEVRQGIIRSHQEGYCNGETRPCYRCGLLENQLADDLVSVDAIAVCAEHMKAVSDDVLSLSKLDEGKVVLEHMLFDLKATIVSVIKMFLASARRKGIELLANLPSEDLHVLGDRGRVAQVLVNLISNAIKFTDIGSVTVELSYLGPTHLGSCKSLFKIAVRDTGCGLNKTEISLLFQRFAQPVSTSFAKHGGTGLGLYISKQLVELMGGLLFVESQERKGSIFFFTFQAESPMVAGHTLRQPGNERRLHDYVTTSPPSPSAASIIHSPKKDQGGGVGVDKTEFSLPTSSPAPSISTISIGTSTSTGQYDLGVRHILVVDDNPIILRILTRMLESASSSSISVSTACNGYDAIGKLIALSTSSLPIDLILMDLEMPFLNGLNTAREIRRLKHPDREESQSLAQRREAERLAATLIIGLTGNVRESRFMEARDSGMDDCIGKPPDKETLCGLIHALFTAKRWRRDEGIRLKLEGLALLE